MSDEDTWLSKFMSKGKWALPPAPLPPPKHLPLTYEAAMRIGCTLEHADVGHISAVRYTLRFPPLGAPSQYYIVQVMISSELLFTLEKEGGKKAVYQAIFKEFVKHGWPDPVQWLIAQDMVEQTLKKAKLSHHSTGVAMDVSSSEALKAVESNLQKALQSKLEAAQTYFLAGQEVKFIVSDEIAKWNNQHADPIGVAPPSLSITDLQHAMQKINKDNHSHAGQKELVGSGPVTSDLGFLLPGLQEVVPCPVSKMGGCDYPPNQLQRVIVHLNDGHRWTREAVADWLDTLDVDLQFPTEPLARWWDPDRDGRLHVLAPNMNRLKHFCNEHHIDWKSVALVTRPSDVQGLRGAAYVVLQPPPPHLLAAIESAGWRAVRVKPWEKPLTGAQAIMDANAGGAWTPKNQYLVVNSDHPAPVGLTAQPSEFKVQYRFASGVQWFTFHVCILKPGETLVLDIPAGAHQVRVLKNGVEVK